MSRSCQRATFSSATTAFPRTLFFQAEDGIRDHCVTGVQTCALPISEERQWLNCVITSGWCPWRIDSESARVLANDSQSLSRRSEERRVGKECSFERIRSAKE